MEMDHRDSDLEGNLSNAELSDTDLEEEGKEASSNGRRLGGPPTGVAPYKTDDVAIIAKIKGIEERVFREKQSDFKMEEELNIRVKEEGVKGGEGSGFSLPVGFPFPHPGGFLPPPAFQPPLPPAPHATSPLSSESSGSSSQQQTWSFEEQFKQVRQLYEISDDPKRKEFLDDLFNFMQRRGTPINRLPIMAKSVLDLYELYNLVIQRGGLVDVINKKLWQEIIKGLHLPSSITSAAFTLRTQYMKYLYPYECEKRRLSTPGELQAAIDGNRREGRRGSYGTYAEMVQRSPREQQAAPLSLVTGRPSLNGGHINNNHLPHHQALLPSSLTGAYLSTAGLAPAEFEVRMAEYVKLLNKELNVPSTNAQVTRQVSPPESPAESIVGSGPPATHSMTPLEMTKLSLWGFYGGGAYSPEQKEALNLEKREDHLPPPPPKRPHTDSDEIHMTGAHIKIATRGDGRGGTDNSSLVVSIDLNGIMYQGVLFAQAPKNSRILS